MLGHFVGHFGHWGHFLGHLGSFGHNCSSEEIQPRAKIQAKNQRETTHAHELTTG